MSDQELIFGLLEAGVTTVQISVGAWFIGITVGLCLAVARDLGFTPLRVAIGLAVVCLRSVPPLVVLYVIFFGLGSAGIQIPSIPAAIVGLGLTDAAFAAEYYRAGFMTVPAAQRDAARSIGLGPFGVLRHVVIPQTIPFVTGPLLNQFVGLLKLATLASAIGAPEILYRGKDFINLTGRVAAVAVIIAALYVGFTMPLTLLVARVELRLRAARGA